ncbi:hypothetical protein [Actinotalea sp.]|uniref:DUF6992 family protein n=1 Tax=Actinotalea sp. TaxID=1872145 RepID=UPI0035657670
MIEAPLLRELGLGAAVSAAGGGALWAGGRRSSRTQVEAFGRQTVDWAAINALLALGGWAALRRRSTAGSRSDETADRVRRLRRVLLVNAGLDVGYVVGGIALARTARRGDGLAIVVQGTFLLWLDTRHARRLRSVDGRGQA